LTHILIAASAIKELSSLTEFCVAELEEVSGGSTGVHNFNAAEFSIGPGFPQPIVQESTHPYTDDDTLKGIVELFISWPSVKRLINFLSL
jgi:hypothetical protein